ncbi:hypothetical protein [Paenibacillus sp. DMB20]|uniref:hypothetical protein n=1 Tax=Paenibacillus sp. DMB20 TaxID=1642570 RepID=UPI000A7C68A7|nr:hypothetical protein [Paenibacillus sp. DMB20]
MKSEIKEMSKHFIDYGLERIYSNLDLTKFREDIDIQKTIQIINWTMLSFSEQQMKKINSFEDIDMEPLEEWDGYASILRNCFYKKEEA